MNKIKTRFEEQEFQNPNHGAFINLSRAVRGQSFSRQNLIKAFKELMPSEEYNPSEKKELIDQLEIISKATEKN